MFLSYYHTRLSYSDVTKIKTPFVNLCNFSNNLLYYYYIPRLPIRVSPITSDMLRVVGVLGGWVGDKSNDLNVVFFGGGVIG